MIQEKLRFNYIKDKMGAGLIFPVYSEMYNSFADFSICWRTKMEN